MTTEASLRIRVDSSEAAKADKTLDDLAKTGAKAEGSTTKLTSSTERLSSAARVAAGAFAALGLSVSVREIVQANDAWQSAANQLRLVTSSAAELTKTQSALMMVANDTRSSFESTANLYARLSRATSEMGLSQTELLGITETINQSFAVSGATAAEAAAAITQLSQGLAAGALRGDEFNSVAEQAPGIMRAIADSLNMTTGELRAFAAEGGITADIVVKALQGASDSIANDFGKSVATFGQSVQIAQNNFIEFAGTSDTVNAGMAALSAIVVNASEGFDELGDALDYTVGMAGDFSEVMGASVSPLLSDISFFVMALRDGFVEFGGAVTETGATVQTGIVQLDAIVNAFFDNFSTGAVSAAELFSLAFGTAVPNTVSVVQTATVAIADAVERMKVIITKSGAEEAAALQALDSIRNRSVTEIIAARDGELSQLYELIKAQADNRKSVAVLASTVSSATETTQESAGATEEAVKLTEEQIKEQDKLKKAYDKSRDSLEDMTGSLENELMALQMTARAAAVFEAVTKATAEGALPAEIARVAELTAMVYDLGEAKGKASQDAENLADANDDAAKKAADAWQRTHEALTEVFEDSLDKGGSVADKIEDAFVGAAKRVAAEWLALKAMNLFNIGGGGTVGSIASIASSVIGGGGGGLGGLAGAVGGTSGGLLSGIPGSASFVGPLPAGGAGIGGTLAGLATNPATWAVAALAYAAKNDFWKDPDNYKRSYAGILTAPTPGAEGSTFAMDAFESGFRPIGIARGASQQTAIEQADVYRALDSQITQLGRKLGLVVDASGATFAGVGKEGQAGTSGTLLGAGGMSTEADFAAMVDLYATQLADHMSGADESLLKAVQSADSAEEVIKELTKALEEQESQLSDMDDARKQASMAVLAAYKSGLSELDAIEQSYEAFQKFAERGLTASHIAQFTGLMESEINAVIARGAAGAEAVKAANQKTKEPADYREFSLLGSGLSDNVLQGTTAEERAGELARRAALQNVLNAADSMRLRVGISDLSGFASGPIDGSHANGLDYVPFDGYRAELHKGKRVQTASQARGSDDAINKLASEFATMRSMMAETAMATRRTADLLLRVTKDGQSLQTTAA